VERNTGKFFCLPDPSRSAASASACVDFMVDDLFSLPFSPVHCFRTDLLCLCSV
jgi:hypothetical protein